MTAYSLENLPTTGGPASLLSDSVHIKVAGSCCNSSHSLMFMRVARNNLATSFQFVDRQSQSSFAFYLIETGCSGHDRMEAMHLTKAQNVGASLLSAVQLSAPARACCG